MKRMFVFAVVLLLVTSQTLIADGLTPMWGYPSITTDGDIVEWLVLHPPIDTTRDLEESMQHDYLRNWGGERYIEPSDGDIFPSPGEEQDVEITWRRVNFRDLASTGIIPDNDWKAKCFDWVHWGGSDKNNFVQYMVTWAKWNSDTNVSFKISSDDADKTWVDGKPIEDSCDVEAGKWVRITAKVREMEGSCGYNLQTDPHPSAVSADPAPPNCVIPEKFDFEPFYLPSTCDESKYPGNELVTIRNDPADNRPTKTLKFHIPNTGTVFKALRIHPSEEPTPDEELFTFFIPCGAYKSIEFDFSELDWERETMAGRIQEEDGKYSETITIETSEVSSNPNKIDNNMELFVSVLSPSKLEHDDQSGPPKQDDGHVHVAPGDTVEFKIKYTKCYSDEEIDRLEYQLTKQGMSSSILAQQGGGLVVDWRPTEKGFEIEDGYLVFEIPFLGEGIEPFEQGHNLKVRMVNGLGFSTDHCSIPIRIWERPGEPQAVDEEDVDWYERGGYFFGEKEKEVGLRAEVPEGELHGNEIDKYTWSVVRKNEEGEFKGEKFLFNAEPGETKSFAFNDDNTMISSDENIWLKCIAQSEYGIPGEPAYFVLKLYEYVQVDAGGPYEGIPGRPVELQAFVTNLHQFEYDRVNYRWRVSTEPGLRFEDGSIRIDSFPVSDLGRGRQMTAAFWMKPLSTGTDDMLLSFREDNDFSNWKYFCIQGSGRPKVGIRNHSRQDTGASPSPGQWHHIAVTWKSEEYELDREPWVADHVRLYMDGQEVWKHDETWPGSEPPQADNDLVIGQGFDGYLDDVSIWRKALNEEDVVKLMDGTLEDPPNLAGLWSLDNLETIETQDGEKTRITRDRSSLRNDGIIEGDIRTSLPAFCDASVLADLNNERLPEELRSSVMHSIENPVVDIVERSQRWTVWDLENPGVKYSIILYPGKYQCFYTFEIWIEAGSEGRVSCSWPTSRDAEYLAECVAEVFTETEEGIELTGEDTTMIAIRAGSPIARSGGPYKGGITGGSFSPIQFEGNVPHQDEPDTTGIPVKIVEWEWTFDKTIRHNQGIDFGEGNYVDVQSFDPAFIDEALSVSAWVKADKGSGGTIMSADGGFQLGIEPGDPGLAFFWVKTDTESYRVQSQFPVDDNIWRHIAGVYNGAWVALYVDSIQQDIIDAEGNLMIPGDVFIGKDFAGCIDEAAIWSRAIERWEIRALKRGEQPKTGDLLGYWDFAEGSGTDAQNMAAGIKDGLQSPSKWVPPEFEERDIWNPAVEYDEPGVYEAKLQVKADTGRWSVTEKTQVTVIDGSITGIIRAADLRTPVAGVTLTLTSPHVLNGTGDLSDLDRPGDNLGRDEEGGIFTLTDVGGSYIFQDLPLGTYRIEASKVEVQYDGTIREHEFETPVKALELTLNAPDQPAVDFVDLSVYPIGGRVYYSIRKPADPNNPERVYVEGAEITAQPVGTTSLIEGLPSTGTPDAKGQNYNLPLFAGKYVFLAKLGGHDIRLIGTQPADPDALKTLTDPEDLETPYGYEDGVLTIEEARNDVHFIDFTTRKVTVYVEDSGGFPIDTFNGERIEAEVTGDNGCGGGEVEQEGEGEKISFEAIVPPGEYTAKLPNVPEAVVKDNKSLHQAKVDLRNQDGTVTMVVPVQIDLEIGPAPKILDPDALKELGELLAEYELTLADLGIDAENNPEGFMYYIPDPEQTQRHTYTITATANGKVVKDFKLKITDNISLFTKGGAPEKRYPDYSDETIYQDIRDDEDQIVEMKYTVLGGLPNMTTPVFDQAGNESKLPKALPKTIKFQAEKDGYIESDPKTLEVTVLGDVPVGSASELVAIPNVNYFVLHDPPGDGSYSYIDDTLVIKGIIAGLKIRNKSGQDIMVYPSPWSEERQIFSGFDQVNFDEIAADDQDLDKDGILQPRTTIPASAAFGIGSVYQGAKGALLIGAGIVGLAIPLQIVDFGLMEVFMTSDLSDLIPQLQAVGIVQFEISPSRHLETPSGDSVSDAMGPGKGDVYYGEGMTVALQMKYRLGIKQNPDFQDDGPNYDPLEDEDKPARWLPDTKKIPTYAALPRGNQYSYTVRDIYNIILDLDDQILNLDPSDPKRADLEDYKGTWVELLNKNPAYVWQRDHIGHFERLREVDKQPSDRQALEDFLAANEGEYKPLGDGGELLMFSAGMSYSYSRRIRESQTSTFSWQISTSTGAGAEAKLGTDTGAAAGIGAMIITMISKFAGTAKFDLGSSVSHGISLESGVEAEQTVGFVLNDDDIGDRISTYVYEGPWGTPIFFTDPGSITSDPWEPNTNKGVDVSINLMEEPASIIPFDYQEGAHYKLKISYDGKRDLDSIFSTIDFLLYAPPPDNIGSLTVRFNGKAEPYSVGLTREAPTAEIALSLYPPDIDKMSSEQREYQVIIQAQEVADPQISMLYPEEGRLKVNFADRRAPRAVVTAPYEGQRISPKVFTVTDEVKNPFKIQVYTEDTDVARIQLEKRSKRPDGVWQEQWDATGVPCWVDPNVFPGDPCDSDDPVYYPSSDDPKRRVFTFDWDKLPIGEGEYAIRAVASDRATDDGQELKPNYDLDPPVVAFYIDNTPPSILTTTPDYQARESQRMYSGELSVTFTDDIKADTINSETFVVTDLEDPEPTEAGFISYSPALRKGVFVPVQPFKSNGFYRAEVKKEGLCDLAGNQLDQGLSWTFRTPDSPFEETWEIVLKATDGISTDANNIAGLDYSSENGEDEKDARAVPGLATQLRLSFLNRNILDYDGSLAEIDRDIRPADGRLSHHWFFRVDNAAAGSTVTLRWKASAKLAKSPAERHYKDLWLIEFVDDGTGTLQPSRYKLTGDLDPSKAKEEVDLHEYTSDGEPRYFRLDVQKASLVATELPMSASGWKFFSVPINPSQADPFVNLGDDIDPLKLYQYNTELKGFEIYPLDLARVALQSGNGYFIRMEDAVEVDVGGSFNATDFEVLLEAAGWHAMGNPFIEVVDVANLSFQLGGETLGFQAASSDPSNWIEATIYSWSDGYVDASILESWEGYWLKTNVDDLKLIIPVPPDMPEFPPLPDSYNPPMMAPPAVAGRERPEADTPGRFDLRLALTSSFASDVTTVLGTHPDAQVGLDPLDKSEPPILSQTVAVYFDHPEWGGIYNTDYQPVMQVGDTRTWLFVAFIDRHNAKMTLSWESSMEDVPDEIFLSFRSEDEGEWKDMRDVQSVELTSESRVTRIPFEVRAERFAMSPPADVQVLAGEAQVQIGWKAEDNPFIEAYSISRRMANDEQPTVFTLKPEIHRYLDTDVEEEETYIYQISVRFITGVELHSDLFTVTVMPVIEETVLLQNYPNPFNPETWIPYELADDADVSVEIYTVAGQLVRRLDLGSQERGRYTTQKKAALWDGCNEAGEMVASGAYFYVLRAGKFSATRKMVIFR